MKLKRYLSKWIFEIEIVDVLGNQIFVNRRCSLSRNWSNEKSNWFIWFEYTNDQYVYNITIFIRFKIFDYLNSIIYNYIQYTITITV